MAEVPLKVVAQNKPGYDTWIVISHALKQRLGIDY